MNAASQNKRNVRLSSTHKAVELKYSPRYIKNRILNSSLALKYPACPEGMNIYALKCVSALFRSCFRINSNRSTATKTAMAEQKLQQPTHCLKTTEVYTLTKALTKDPSVSGNQVEVYNQWFSNNEAFWARNSNTLLSMDWFEACLHLQQHYNNVMS